MTNENEEQPSLDGWEDFSGQYLKIDLIDSFPIQLPVINISSNYIEDGNSKRPLLSITTEYKGKDWDLNLNKTNQNFLRGKGIKSPKEIIGKLLVFDKCKVRNPSTNSMVDSFILIDVKDKA